MIPHLAVSDLRVHYPIRRGVLRRQVGATRAVDGVGFAIPRGRTFGLVGESGCGKSSLARAILRLQEPTGGQVLLAPADGPAQDILTLPPQALRRLRREMQIVFQDPYSALNPRLRVGTSLSEPVRAIEGAGAAERGRRVAEALDAVGLPVAAARLYPHEFSGGQRQRIAIARALITRPHLLVLDEPVSALDMSVRAQILNLLVDTQQARGLTYLFVSHDLSVVRYLCDEVGVMYLGRIVEQGPAALVLAAPRHPYTRLLLSAVPVPRPHARQPGPRLAGDPPDPSDIPPGCPFHTRCPLASEISRTDPPETRGFGGGHLVACHHA